MRTVIYAICVLCLACCGRSDGESYSDVDDAELKEICTDTEIQELWLRESPKLTASGFAHLATLPNLRTLGVQNNQISEQGAAELGKLSQLTFLNLRHSNIDDKGAKHLANLTELTQIHLSYNQKLTDRGISHLVKLKNLQVLVLDETPGVTDESIKYFKRMPNLSYLRVVGAGLSAQGAQQLRDFGIDVDD